MWLVAYAFAWMQFPGRDWLFVIVVSLMVVPTQLAFLPILQGFSGIASWATALNQWLTDCEITDSCQVASKSFASLWITHTAFGLPLAIYLLRNYIVGLPKELLQSARIDGAKVAILNKDFVVKICDRAGQSGYRGCTHREVKLVCLKHVIARHLACHSLYG